jgi:hypothetical protein
MQQRLFFFKFAQIERPTPLNLGCGVTAYDIEDATRLIRDRFFQEADMPDVLSVSEIHDLSEVDQKHVAPNMGSPLVRGVWFPLGN